MMCLTSPSTRLRLARALVLACGLFSATFSTHAVTMPFTVNLDTNLSVAHISIDVLGKNDSQDAQLAGSFVVDIDSLPTPTSAGPGVRPMDAIRAPPASRAACASGRAVQQRRNAKRWWLGCVRKHGGHCHR